MSQAPVVLMGDEIYLERVRFVVRGNQIHVLSGSALAPVHFAGHLCWNGGWQPDDFLAEETCLYAWQPLVPLLSSETEHTVHLMFDFFRNGWKMRNEVEYVGVPRIRTDRR